MAEPVRVCMSKRWMLTYFGDDALTWVPPHDASVVYGCWQREICPDTQRPHIHAYYRFGARRRLTTVQKFLGKPNAHLEASVGTERQNSDYCTKEDTRLAVGETWSPQNFDPDLGQGARTDLKKIAAACVLGTPLREIALTFSSDFIRYHSGIQALHDEVAPLPPIERPVQIVVFWGATGVGKTHRVLMSFPGCYQVKPGRDPWGMYRSQDCIFFDEFLPSRWELTDMNRFLDKWRCLLDSRYHDRYAAWTHVCICSNANPSCWYPEQPLELLLSFRRRLASSCYLVTSREQELENMDQTPNWGVHENE